MWTGGGRWYKIIKVLQPKSYQVFLNGRPKYTRLKLSTES